MIANATSSVGSYFFTGPLNLTLIIIVVASIAYSAWMEVRNRRYTSKEEIMQ
jgi:putative tricarboxylic transport membrane protein